jgi:periplasmic protein TonB
MSLALPDHPESYSPNSEHELSFSFKKKDVQRVLFFVIGLHIFIFLLALFGLPDFRLAKRPDITIEIGAAPTASNGPVSNTKPSATPVKDTPKEKTPPLVKDKDGIAAPTTPIASVPSTSAASGGPAAAPTADADYKAAYLQNPKPPYPPLAFRMRIEGKVVILTEVLPDGRAGNVRVVESSGNELLDQSALTTVRQWKFTPARKDGVIVTQAVRIPITFSLKNR